MNNINDGNQSLLYSLLLSMDSQAQHEVTMEDKRYAVVPTVSKCQLKIYQIVIECLCKGMSYPEIIDYIDNIDIEEYKSLKEEEKEYVQRKVRKDLNSREKNLKERGVN